MSESLASAFAQLVAARYTHARATLVIDHVVHLAASVVPGASAATKIDPNGVRALGSP